ncbi:PfkB family carbohydrate kinase [Anaerolineales bacterium HSG25]|nr:PfkB family carbohydrate kinase [Anaerolineales bacterium HSG25]
MLDSVDICVIGTTSLDTLHLTNQTTAHVAGGAGLYTALAAHQAQANVGLFGPRPTPMPEPLQPFAERVTWLGPLISPDGVARLEIAHYGGGKAELLTASWGAESEFLPLNIPSMVTESSIIHLAALSTAERQLDFLLALLDNSDDEIPFLSVGTYGRLVHENRERVAQLFELADIFFMNNNEATGFFGSVDQATTRPEALLFVTLGEQGALVVTHEQTTHIPAIATTEIDPTGAGDTFCGVTLAGLYQGLDPVSSAQQAVVMAAQTVSGIGPARLLVG